MRGITLLEILVVIIIMGIFSTLGITHYGSYRENTLNREAQANLAIIIAGERIARMEAGNFIACANTVAVNTNLRLLLSTAADANWNYRVTVGGASNTCAEATRNGGDARTWRIRDTEDAPVVGACP